MSIPFAPERWNHIRAVYAGWWNRTLERPVINLTLTGAPSDMSVPDGYLERAMWQYPNNTPIERILRDELYAMSTRRYAADAFPVSLPDYGAGVNAAFCGCKVEIREETVWFLPPSPDITAKDLRLEHDPESHVYAMLCEYYEKAPDFFEGRAVVGMTHLNNGIDIAARFLDGTEMGLALYDRPGEVKRLIGENHLLFTRYLDELSACMGTGVPGYSCWGNMYGEKPWYGTQSDFCAMIGPDAFAEFILPELALCWAAFPEYNYYHLDGPGQLVHLGMILASPNLKCVQWVPGDGAAPAVEWLGIYRKIADAGKNIWYMGSLGELERVADMAGTARGLYWQGSVPWDQRDEARSILERLGVPFAY